MADGLEFARPEADDWRQFLDAATGEGWRVPATELQLFRGPLADSALVLRCGGRFVGMVTLVNHGQSAWIGNLMVPAGQRGKGYGKLLLDRAISRLEEQQARSIWLTASEAGFPLYRRRGFETFGQVERWILSQRGSLRNAAPWPAEDSEALRDADAGVWGEQRFLLEYLLPKGRLLLSGGSVALLQREPGLQILGPWFACGGQTDLGRLLELAVAAAKGDEELVIDLRAGTVPQQILEKAGFVLRGRTRLMVRGDAGGIDLQPLVSFASLGSMG